MWKELWVVEPADGNQSINSSNLTAARQTIPHSVSTNGNGCTLIDAYWASGYSQITHSQPDASVDLFIESKNCIGQPLSVTVYQKNAVQQSVVKVFDGLTIGNNITKLTWKLSSTIPNVTSYYFSAQLGLDSDNSMDSAPLILDYPNSVQMQPSFLCQGFGDDRDYLYAANSSVFTKSDGRLSFIVSLNGTMLRNNYSEDRFFYDNSNGAVNVSYTIVPTCGGVDIVYTVKNPTSVAQRLPDFTLGGIQQSKTHPRFLSTLQWGTLADVVSTALYDHPWPDIFAYSPVMVTVNDKISYGTSIQYPFLEYKVNVLPYMEWGNDGTLNQRYVFSYDSSYLGPQRGMIASNTEQHYTVSVRFAPARNWILTLEPYKKYFTSLYGSSQGSKDLRPVAAVTEAYREYYSAANPRGYVDWYNPGKRLDIDGWNAEVTRLLSVLTTQHYKRLMLWHTAGVYDPSACPLCYDFPAQFMDWMPKVAETQSELQRIRQAGISLGFWWGRSGQVPVPQQWPPASFVSDNYTDPSHISYRSAQFNFAKQRGADMLGLDSFTYMAPYDRFSWLSDMKSQSSISFVHENGGADIFHRYAANFYTDPYQSGSWTSVGGPHVLGWYLNPGSEIWILGSISNGDRASVGQQAIVSRAQKLAHWGYTFVDNGPFIDTSSIDLTLSQCLDGRDNNGNGLVDWPKDPGCTDEFDETE